MTIVVEACKVHKKKNEIALMRQNYFKCMNLSAQIIA